MRLNRSVILAAISLVVLQLVQCSFARSGADNGRTEPATLPLAESSASLPTTAEQVIDRYVQALGGLEASRSVVSIEAKGAFELPESNVTGSVEYYAKAPNKAGTVLRTPDNSLFTIQAYDGSVGWERSLRADEGRAVVREIKGAELSQLRLDSEFYREYRLKELYPRLTLKGRQKVDDRDSFAIEAVPAGANTETMYFDVQTGLLVRRDLTAVTPQGNTPVEVYFDDYKVLPGSNGVKVSYTRTLIFPDYKEGNTIFKFSQARANVELKDSTFAMPAR